ncbi:hypothetical protein [Actinokineospora sp. NBRC 105648]|uniref:hypothetical protein n=1 Tax=Actinokineospora sp. NBRC 105648 TaxID=3032206 RepID=UPI0024A3CABA|nr:hypothetical protein [Actinokineospora sp. NBRC 105648]GLZ40497.1 hypothetical protein Acsp05_41210 [Actinokineospora sp. NBRC 105648]
MRTMATRFVLAVTVGLSLAWSATPASAQDEPDYPIEVGQPTLATAISVCDGGTSGVEVVLDDRTKPYTVTLAGSGLPAKKSTYDDEHEVNRVVFTPVPVGEYTVEVAGADEASDGVPVVVKPCSDLDPTKGELSIDVKCRGGWGLVTFEVANPSGDDVRTYALAINGPTSYNIELSPGVFLNIHENLWDDGTYQAALSGDGFETPLVKHFTVKCASENSPQLGTYAQCDDKTDVTTPAVVFVEIDNPNRAAVDYTVTAGKVTKKVTVAGAGHGSADLGAFPAGDYPVTVKGSDGTEVETGGAVDHCADVVVDRDGLQVSVRCVDGDSVVTARFYAVGPYPAERKFSVDGNPRFNETVRFDGAGVYQWTRSTGLFDDGVYTAHLVGSGLKTVEKFTVDCKKAPTTTPASTTPSTPSNPDTTTTSPGTVPATSSSALPVAQGSAGPSVDGGLPVTGAAIGGMVVLGAAALGLGGFLLVVARRRRAN